MAAVLSLLIIIFLSLIVIRIGAVALELTGLSTDISSFQAQSAFSGVGFTTSESESIFRHPLRRRIIRVLILLGSAGVTTSMATLVIAFMGQSTGGFLLRAQALLAGLMGIWLLFRSRSIRSLMKIWITVILEKFTVLRLYDYEQLFGLGEGYVIAKIAIKENSPLIDKPIKDLKERLKGVLILGIHRNEEGRVHLIGTPHGDTMVRFDDELICYGEEEVLHEDLFHMAPESAESNEV